MPEVIPTRRARVMALILVLSVSIVATTAFAATKLIEADKGGVVPMGHGVKLTILPNALEEDTEISAEMEYTEDRINFHLGPSGTEFSEPAELRLTWKAIGGRDVENIALYDENDQEIETEPEIENSGVVFYIEHFSIYYHRRR
jgi:hypothetical protein